MSRPPIFTLPNSPACRVVDRFSDVPHIAEDENGQILYWPLLCHLIQQPISTPAQLIDCLQSISANAGGESTAGDYGMLKTFLHKIESQRDFYGHSWPKIRDIALDLPFYFPSSTLSVLEPGQPLRLTRGQVSCLVVHQFLCSSIMQRHGEDIQDFSIWYDSEQQHPRAANMYLTALFTYFDSLPDASSLRQDHQNAPDKDNKYVTYALYRNEKAPCLEGVKMGPVQIEYLDRHNTESHLPEVQGTRGAVVVSANKSIGFGRSATQEEIFVGIAPEACPAVLFAPVLTDDTVLCISGARAMLAVTGQRRDIQWEVRPCPPLGKGFDAWLKGWAGGNLIFMDALEMDMVEAGEELPDLKPQNIDREILKALTGFTSHKFDRVWTGLWGCGAFCGNPDVKLLLLWIAASLAGVKLSLMLSTEHHEIGRRSEKVMRSFGDMTAQELRRCLDLDMGTLRDKGMIT